MYRVEVDWAPAYELLVSLKAYVARTEHKMLELGTQWARRVRRQLHPELAATLAARDAMRGINLVDLLVYQCPRERDAASFLEWLASLSDGELYERLAPSVVRRHVELLGDLGELRDRAVRLLSAWNEQYFRTVQPEILEGLREDSKEKRALIETTQADELVEMATSGVHFVPEIHLDVVLLIPQYHFRPWNLHDYFQRTHLVQYPADVLQPVEGEPSPRLLRLVRALSDESRLRILRMLAQGPATFTDVRRFTGLSKSTVNHHMVALRAAGLVRVHGAPKERMLTYTLRENALDELGERLRAYLGAVETLTPIQTQPTEGLGSRREAGEGRET
jgi:DNA-binding transcriptional ArsR family regulator